MAEYNEHDKAPDKYQDKDNETGDEDEVEDLSDVADIIYPESGWHRVTVEFVSNKPTKEGKARRSALIIFKHPSYYRHWEGFVVGSEGPGGEVAKRRFKAFAKACGVVEEKGAFMFKLSELSGAELYVLVGAVDATANFPVKINVFRPITDPPDVLANEEGETKTETVIEDLPF